MLSAGNSLQWQKTYPHANLCIITSLKITDLQHVSTNTAAAAVHHDTNCLKVH